MARLRAAIQRLPVPLSGPPCCLGSPLTPRRLLDSRPRRVGGRLHPRCERVGAQRAGPRWGGDIHVLRRAAVPARGAATRARGTGDGGARDVPPRLCEARAGGPCRHGGGRRRGRRGRG